MPTTLKILPPKVDAGYSHQHGYQGDEAPTQTFVVGNFITPDSNGKYALASAGAAAVTSKLRVAMAPGQNLAVPRRRTEFAHPRECGVIEITAGGAASTADLLEATKTYGLAFDATTQAHYLNLADTTNAVFTIADSKPRYGEIGDTNVRVLVTVNPGSI